MLLRRSYGPPVAAMGGFTPTDLGASLLAFWDAERADLITQASTLISSWKDVVAGYDAVQAVGASKFVYSATSFNGRPGAAIDGVDDEMTCLDAALLALLGGAAGYEIWAAESQDALPADTTTRYLVTVGDGFGNTSRSINRIVSGGVNRARSLVGSGGAAVSATLSTVDFSGIQLVRSVITPTGVTTYVDGTASSTAAVVPSTTATRLRMGANAGAGATGLYNGKLNFLAFTSLLTAPQAALMSTWGNTRKGA